MARSRNLLSGIRNRFTFRLRAESLPGDLRPEWRIALVLLMILRSGRGNKMSLKKAHLLNWAVRTAIGRHTLMRMVEGERHLSDIPVRFDPALNRAVDFALAEKLVHLEKKSTGSIITLLPAGVALAEKVFEDEDCMEVEKAFFNGLRGNLPEDKVAELLEWETSL